MDAPGMLRAAAANHRSWFRRCALAEGGRVERAGTVELVCGRRAATIAFPRSRRVGAAVERIRELGLGHASCWSLGRDDALGVRLIARGFGWGWQPHWMALDLASVADEPVGHPIEPRRGPLPRGVPDGGDAPDPPAAIHLVVCGSAARSPATSP